MHKKLKIKLNKIHYTGLLGITKHTHNIGQLHLKTKENETL